jgi:hypothetical protein
VVVAVDVVGRQRVAAIERGLADERVDRGWIYQVLDSPVQSLLGQELGLGATRTETGPPEKAFGLRGAELTGVDGKRGDEPPSTRMGPAFNARFEGMLRLG